MTKVFLSHAWNDKVAAGRRLKTLEMTLDDSFDLWVDKHGIAHGASIQDSVRDAIAAADIIVLAWSANAARSDGVRKEIDIMGDLQKPVLIATLDDHSVEEIGLVEQPLVFPMHEGLDEFDFELNLERIRTAILTMVIDTNPAYERLRPMQHRLDALVRELQDTQKRRSTPGRRAADATPFITKQAQLFGQLAADAEGPCREAFRRLSTRLQHRDDLALLNGHEAERALAAEIEAADPQGQCLLIQQFRQLLRVRNAVDAPSDARPAGDPIEAIAARVRRMGAAPDARIMLRLRIEEVLAFQGRASFETVAAAEEQFAWYVSVVPELLAELRTVARQADPGGQLQAVVEGACAYVVQEDDLIPDTAGVLGLLDDTFFVLACIDLLNRRALRTVGQPLLAFDPTAWANELALLLTPAVIEQLFQLAEQTVVNILGPEAPVPTAGPLAHAPGSWGASWEDEMARRAALLGISL